MCSTFKHCRPSIRRLLLAALATGSATAGVAVAQEADDIAPAPPSIGADIPLTYFGPPPTAVNPRLIGPLQLLKAGQLDTAAGTITLPLYQGQLQGTGQKVWFILTDTTDVKNAEALGLNHSAKLAYGETCRGARQGTLEVDGTVTFDKGTVDFSPERRVVPGEAPNRFPPTTARPGAVGDSDYSPLVRIQNAGGHVYNAPVVAFDVEAADISFCESSPDATKVHDKVVRICPADGTVTLSLTPGFSFGRPVLYLSMDANTELAAAMEGVTLAPGLTDIRVGGDDGAFSAVERIFGFVNGPTNVVEGEVNPQRQGFNSALAGEGGPLNVLGGIPTIATDYSPLWDLNLGEWTQAAIDAGYRSRLTEEFAILGFVQRGFITGPGGATYGSTGNIINCPIVHRFL
ncbi:MAG: hypothetical protein L0Y66_00905 [Myxococcaceae bacterium]|nr:hypothetical protein [Myxococcaceae bacterium]MCI0669705.1 hypothetical protein [Myxococcaceae bacterium]